MERKLVTVWTFSFPLQAEMAQHVLTTNGIQSFLSNLNIVAMDWFMGNAVGGVKLQVADDDAAAALKILEMNPGLIGRRPPDLDDQGDSFNCLACGHTIAESENRCSSCGWSPN